MPPQDWGEPHSQFPSSRTSTSTLALRAVDAAERRSHIDELPARSILEGRLAAKLGGAEAEVSLCCALIHDPDLLVLDEPTTGVDPAFARPVLGPIDTIRASPARHGAPSSLPGRRGGSRF